MFRAGRTRRILPVFCFVLLPGSLGSLRAAAPADSPEGLWKTIDDRKGTERSLVRIWREGDELRGRVERVFPGKGEPEHPTCRFCSGDKKDRPIEGLEILWGFRQDGGEWTGGRVLDPEEGKTYKCKLRLIEGGQKLVVRGYIGISMFGRSQTWVRIMDRAAAKGSLGPAR